MDSPRFRKFCWGVLLYTLGVIVWGGYVRASGSGAGCGSHWPTCNGEVIPADLSGDTLVELTHRITSAISGFLVLAQLVFAWRNYPSGHRVRKALMWSTFLVITEGAIGAGLVVFEYVDQNKTVGRALWMAVHLVNTFMLVAALTLSAHFVSGGRGFRLRGQKLVSWIAVLSLLGMLLVGASGAVAALGDTLFPARSWADAIAADLSPTAHVLVRLRILHPFAAVFVAFGVLLARYLIVLRRPEPSVQRWGFGLRVAVLVQLAVGLGNLVLLAPTTMQLLHLLLAEVVWIALILFLAQALAATPRSASAPQPDG